jgi:hypothetical protein
MLTLVFLASVSSRHLSSCFLSNFSKLCWQFSISEDDDDVVVVVPLPVHDVVVADVLSKEHVLPRPVNLAESLAVNFIFSVSNSNSNLLIVPEDDGDKILVVVDGGVDEHESVTEDLVAEDGFMVGTIVTVTVFSGQFTASCLDNSLPPPPVDGEGAADVPCAVPGDPLLPLLAHLLLLPGPVLLSPPCAGCWGSQAVFPDTSGGRDGAVSALALALLPGPGPLPGAGGHRGGRVDGDDDGPGVPEPPARCF